ncbi:Peptidoglycan/LPS O-acetylase OafA/YrhL, contains acyltransferase and SGNH-hydrolase domains [Methylobacterium sp. 174MFSha1.1]|uniref:acyltransferase family protein n=1 Tax=Methylobacterium sp. 174MFSha1.1 TaxID=1502749 RepID=UPI0008E4E9D8|nr:acyltransferase [Methylobacterium sp. 174MFSha1.1]SFU68250.1 Peptidoglycan/LPS O-acetylase OafA/YrhL, contains acyltransferase and SGNH-hydrolase domains [Methylobacterium sp. 174MFSha1.1]
MRGREGSERFEALDAGRGVCALAVAFFHMPLAHPWQQQAWFPNLQFCVDVFFVLSGFVLLHAYGDRLATGRQVLRFGLMRFGRLWPLHAATLGLLVLIEGVRFLALSHHAGAPGATPPFGPEHRPVEIVTHLLFLQNFRTFGEYSWNFPSWSIAVEFWASLVLAAIVMAAGPRRRLVFAGLAGASALALWWVSPRTLFVIQNFGIVRCLFDLFLGCLAYTLRDALRLQRRLATPAEILALLALPALVLLSSPGPLGYGASLAFAAAIALFSHQGGAVSDLARARGPQRLGRWSFSIYLLHLPMIQVFVTAVHAVEARTGLSLTTVLGHEHLVDLGSGAANLAAAAALVALTVPLAALTHRVIERPSLAWFKRVDAGLAAPTARTPAAVAAMAPR